MKFTKKKTVFAITSALLLAAIMTVWGSLAYFKDSQSTSGSVKSATFKLDKEQGTPITLFSENAPFLLPGQEIQGQIVTVVNSGNVEEVVVPAINIALNKDGHALDNTQEALIEIESVWTKIPKNGQPTTQTFTQNLATNAANYAPGSTYFKSQFDKVTRTLQPGDKMQISIKVKLNETAGNEYQGHQINATVTANTYQANDPASN